MKGAQETRTHFGTLEALPSGLLSHSIFATAISHVSRIALSGWERYGLRIGREDGSEMAPIASAACSRSRVVSSPCGCPGDRIDSIPRV